MLASWSDLLNISDLVEAGTQAFITTLTDEQKLHYNEIISDKDKLAYQQELREQTVTNRRTRHTGQFPLSDNLMPLIFLVQADLNEQQDVTLLKKDESLISPNKNLWSLTNKDQQELSLFGDKQTFVKGWTIQPNMVTQTIWRSTSHFNF